MSKDVEVFIKAFHKDGIENSKIETINKGKCFFKDNKYYVCYEEKTDNANDVLKTTIKISEDKVEVIKRGETDTHMKFIQEYTDNTYLYTVMGKISVSIHTEILKVTKVNDEIKVIIEYELLLDSKKVSECNMEIIIK